MTKTLRTIDSMRRESDGTPQRKVSRRDDRETLREFRDSVEDYLSERETVARFTLSARHLH